MFNFFKKNNDENAHNSRQSAPVDMEGFLSSCIEAQKNRQMEGDRSIEWPTLQDFSGEELKEEFAGQRIEEIFSDLVSWYVANFPILNESSDWQEHQLPEISSALASMFADFENVHKAATENELPKYSGDNSLWVSITGLLKKLFDNKKSFVEYYLKWKFSDSDEKPKYGNNKPNNRHNNNNNNRNNSNNRNNGKRGPRRPQLSDEEKEQRAIGDCIRAIERLKANPEEPMVSLKPKNSYFRRIQHNYAVENGYYTKSKGEGRDRMVVIYRNEDMA